MAPDPTAAGAQPTTRKGGAKALTQDATKLPIPTLTEIIVQGALSADAALMRSKTIRGANSADSAAFRLWLYKKILQLSDVDLVDRFKARYPTVSDFDSAGFKQFLRLSSSPGRRLWAIDKTQRGTGLDARRELAKAANAPNRDGRYRDRLIFDKKTRKAARDAYQRLVPVDPSTLSLGRPYGKDSELSATLVPPAGANQAETLGIIPPMQGAERAQQFTDLSLVATRWKSPASTYFSLAFAGHALWHVIGAADPLMTSPYIDDQIIKQTEHLYRWRAFLTAGGYLAPLEPRTQTAARLAQNMRHFATLRKKALVAEAMENPTATNKVAVAVRSLISTATITPEIEGSDTTQSVIELTRAIASEAASERNGLAAAIRDLACGRLFIDGFRVRPEVKGVGHSYDDLVCQTNTLAEQELDKLVAHSISRATRAVQRYDSMYRTEYERLPDTFEATLSRLVKSQLTTLAMEDERHGQWLAQPPNSPGPGIHTRSIIWPAVQGTILIALTLWFWWMLRRPLPPMERMLKNRVQPHELESLP